MSQTATLAELAALFEGSAFAAGFARWLGREHVTLDDALGLAPGPGQRDPRTLFAIEERDRLLRHMAVTWFPGLPVSHQAEAIANAIARYRSGPDWRRDRTREAVDYRDTLRGDAWAVLKVRDHAPAAGSVRETLRRS